MKTLTFITGPAGTGKSTLLRKLLSEEERPYLIVAPTGIAAVNVGGATIHRTFKIHSESGFIGQKWPNIQVVYVDEASMMGARLFDFCVAGAPNADFVLVGDMAQLPPVKDKYWFQSKEVSKFNIKMNRLTVNYRQKSDRGLVDVLNSIRDGSVTRDDLRWLYSNSALEKENEGAITLAFRNDTVRAINAEKLLALRGDVMEYEAEYSGVMEKGHCIAESDLALKVGAEVIMLNNDLDKRWSNGTRGVVHKIREDSIDVVLNPENENIEIATVQMHTWNQKAPKEVTPARRAEIERDLSSGKIKLEKELFEHYLETGIEYVVIGSCKQLPVKLAYAMTVHKAQGMTLPNIHIMSSGFAGCHGIGYVALSRATNLDGISFERRPAPTDFRFDERLKMYI